MALVACVLGVMGTQRGTFLDCLLCLCLGILARVCWGCSRQEDWKRKYLRLYNDPVIREIRRQVLAGDPPEGAEKREPN